MYLKQDLVMQNFLSKRIEKKLEDRIGHLKENYFF